MKDSFKDVFKSKKRILVIMPHPDDCEIYCGGTVARLVRSDFDVRVVKMTYGEKGCKQEKISSSELKNVRKREDKKAMKELGIKRSNNIYLDLGDGSVEENIRTIEILVRQIREFKPDLIITTNPEDIIIRFDKGINWVNHRDHLNTARNAVNAAYPYSRDILFFPDHFKDKKLKSHICTEFLFTDYYNHEDCVLFDVTDFIDERITAHACHESQYSLEDVKETTDFFTKGPDYPKGRNFEKFRYVVAD